jgi:enoyl-CoA hydratase
MSNDVDGQPAPEVLCERRGAAGVITLNRPQALNAITQGMVREIRRALDAWADDPAVTRIVLRGAGERAFCAGGDIRHLYELGIAGRQDEALTFWRDEYALNVLIKNYPKPYLSLIDGIVMGGGVGVSLHGSHRIAGDRYAFAMPEVAIGFFPDVGATYALPRLPGRTGTYIALTGERIRTADALALGLATHAVPSANHAGLLDALVAGGDVEAALSRFSRHPGDGALSASRAVIDECFAAHSVEAVLDRLDGASARGSDFAARIGASIRTKSPTSLKVAYEQMRRGGGLSFEDAMRTEFRIVSRVVHGYDFYEGVRATIIDKDGAPQWRPTSLGDVSGREVERYFGALGPAELELPTT